MSTERPRRVKCARCEKTFVVAGDEASLPAHDDANQQPCPGSAAVPLATPVGVGDEVDAWLPPPTGYERSTAGEPEAVNLAEGSRRRATIVSANGGKLRVRDPDGAEYDVDAGDLGEAQPEWVGKGPS